MAETFYKLAGVMLATAVAVTGCQSQKKDDVRLLARAADVAQIAPVAEYARPAVDAAGGFDAWTKVTELKLDCLATFYQPDGSIYLTEQSYTIYPWSNAIRMSGEEPGGQFTWQLADGQLTVPQGSADVESLTVSLPAKRLAESLLMIVTVAARFTDKSVEFSAAGETVRIRGRWYRPINRLNRPDAKLAPDLPAAVFYMNRDSSVVDVIGLAYPGAHQLLSVRAYDYRKVDGQGVLVPGRIEVVETDQKGFAEKPLVKVDVK